MVFASECCGEKTKGPSELRALGIALEEYPYASAEARAKMGDFVGLGRAAAKEIPHGTLVVVPDCGHIPHLEKPREFQQALMGFLRGSK